MSFFEPDRLKVICNHFGFHSTDVMNVANSPITTHILDATKGGPASEVKINLYRQEDGQWKIISHSVTDGNGRCGNLIRKDEIIPAVYKLHFDTAGYYRMHGIDGFYPYVDIVFEVKNPDEHYHVPLILNPFSYTTYRGS